MSAQPKFPVKHSTGLDRLLGKAALIERIAGCRDEIQEVLLLVQRDAVDEANRGSSGDVVYGIKLAMETIDVLAIAGEDSKAKRSTGESPKSTKRGKP